MTNSRVLAKDTRLIIVAICWLLLLFALWNTVAPWLAERNYRDGFVANTYKRYDQSIQKLNQAMSYTPWETYYLITQVKNYEAMSKKAPTKEEKVQWLKKAEETYQFMIMINHTNPWYLNGLAAIELALFNYTEDKEEREQLLKNAEEAYKTASEVDALNPLFQMSLAFYYHRSGRVEEAYKLYSRSVELDDWFVEAYNNMAEIELGRGNREKAMTYFEEMARADDENFSPETKLFNHWVKGGNFKNYRSKLGELHLLRKNYDQAIIHFKKALEKRENDEKVWRSLGTAYHQSKQMELAIYAYKQALTLNPDLMDVYKYLGYAYYNVGLFNSSQENLVKYLKSNPEDQKVVDDLGRIRQSLRKRRR